MSTPYVILLMAHLMIGVITVIIIGRHEKLRYGAIIGLILCGSLTIPLWFGNDEGANWGVE